jgi:hypothetical protein
MLSDQVDAVSLVVDRMMDFESRMDKFMHGNDMQSYLASIGSIFMVIGTLLFMPPFETQVYSIDLDWIAREKVRVTNEQDAASSSSSSSSSSFPSPAVAAVAAPTQLPPPTSSAIPSPTPLDGERKENLPAKHHRQATQHFNSAPPSPSTRQALATSRVDFVSTNDILTSWFFHICRTQVGQMAFNFRNRIPELTDSHAGNYEGMIGYQPEDYSHPTLIRRSIASARRQVSTKFPPFVLSALRGSGLKLGLVTNWTSFYRDVTFAECSSSLHLPILLASTFLPLADLGVIFRPTKDSLAFLITSRSCKETTLLKQPALKGRLLGSASRKYFPLPSLSQRSNKRMRQIKISPKQG